MGWASACEEADGAAEVCALDPCSGPDECCGGSVCSPTDDACYACLEEGAFVDYNQVNQLCCEGLVLDRDTQTCVVAPESPDASCQAEGAICYPSPDDPNGGCCPDTVCNPFLYVCEPCIEEGGQAGVDGPFCCDGLEPGGDDGACAPAE